MVNLVDSNHDNHEKSMFLVNLSGLLFGFLLIGITSDSAVALINTSHFLMLFFSLAASFLAFSMIFGLFVYYGVFIPVFNIFALMWLSFTFLVLGLISVLCFIFTLVMGNRFFDYIVGFLFGAFIVFFIFGMVYKIYLMCKSG